MPKIPQASLLLLLLLITSLNAICQSTIPMTKLEGTIEFDGKPDEPAWEKASPFPMITHTPTFGIDPSQQTDIRLLYDDNYFYLGATMFVTDPEFIMVFGKKRDLNSATCDWLGVSLDTYNDKKNSLLFFTNPNGVRWDATISNDGATLEKVPLNLNWNTFWEVKTEIENNAWHAEFKIPISSLRFRGTDEIVTMGLSFFRYLPRLNESYIFPEIPFDWGDYSKMKPSQYAEVNFQGIKPRKPLYVSPYLLTGFEQTNTINTAETAYEYEFKPLLEPGLDIKYGINSNTTLDLTVNTDFAQVEADDQQFNITRFSLVLEEKRPFFLERAGVFDFEFGGGNTLFYSRQIGLYSGSPVRILGGARLVTKVNDWDIGVMDMQTSAFMDLPSENFGVFRAKKTVFNPNSYAGGMLTSRIGMDGTYNIAYGIDGVFNLFGNEYLTIRWSQTFDDQYDNNPFSLHPSRYLFSWQRRRENGLSYYFAHIWSGSEFDPGIGLEVFQNYYGISGSIKYTWLPPAESALQSHNLNTVAYQLNDVVSKHVLISQVNQSWTFNLKNAWVGSISLVYNHHYLEQDFAIAKDLFVPSDSYNYFNADIILSTPYTLPYKVDLALSTGQYFDGFNFSPKIEPSLNIGANLELGGIYRYDYIKFATRDQLLGNHIFGMRGLYMFSTKLSLSAFVQYNTAIEKVISNVRFRYNPKEGTDLYIVFNEGRNNYLDREVPNLPIYDARSVILKFTYTFDL